MTVDGSYVMYVQINMLCHGAEFLLTAHCKKISVDFTEKITGNQLPVHFPLFFTGARKHFQESDTER